MLVSKYDSLNSNKIKRFESYTVKQRCTMRHPSSRVMSATKILIENKRNCVRRNVERERERVERATLKMTQIRASSILVSDSGDRVSCIIITIVIIENRGLKHAFRK